MARYNISFEVVVPDYITENMVTMKFDNLGNEFYEHLDGELREDDEVLVENVSFWTK